MNDTTPTTSPRPKGKKNKIRPKLKPIVSTDGADDDDDEGLGYGNWKILGDQNNKLIASRDNNTPTTTTTTTTTTSPQPKTKKKKNKIKIRPKVKPIVSTDEADDDDDEGLGYGEWAASSPTKPSPIKPRQVISSERSGNSEEQDDDDEKKVEDEDTIHVIRKINSKLFLQQQPPPPSTNEKEEKVMIIQPEDDMTRLDNNNDVVVASSSSRPITLQSKQRRDFDHNKLQFFENNITSGGEKKMKVSDNNRAKTATTTDDDATTHTTPQQNVIYQIASELESELLEEAKEVDRKWLYYWSRIIIWKGAILLLCIALCWKVLLRITEMSLSHNNVELSSSTIGEALSWWNKEVVSVTATTMDENIAGEVLWSSRGKKEDVPDDIKLAGMEEEEEESVETTIEDMLPSEEATMSASSVVDDDPEENELVKSREDATDDGIIHSEIEISLSTEEERETHESRHYDYPSTQDAEGSESGVSEQVSDCEVEEHIMLTARADNNLVEIEVGIKVEAFFDKNEQQSKPVIKPIVEATDGYEAASTVPGGNTIQAH